MVVSSRERILDAAMELFGRQGFKATSVVQIEAAAGLSPGSGGIYHYFRNKEALLEAGIARHLGRLDALRDIQRIMFGVGDLRTELILLARYTLAVVDREVDLLRIVVAEARTRPEAVAGAVEALVRAGYAGFSGWIRAHAEMDPARADALAVIGLGGLFAARLPHLLLGAETVEVTDELLVTTWAETMHAQLAGPT
jgi:AcrR family transcriptional regulator